MSSNTKSVQSKPNPHQTHRHYLLVGGASKEISCSLGLRWKTRS